MAPTHAVANRSLYIDMGGVQECRSVRNCILRIAQVHQFGALPPSGAAFPLLLGRSSFFALRPRFLLLPASLRARVAKDEEEWFCLSSYWSFCFWAAKAAFKYGAGGLKPGTRLAVFAGGFFRK